MILKMLWPEDEDADEEDPVGEVAKDNLAALWNLQVHCRTRCLLMMSVQGVGSTDAATGATIVGPDFPVVVTPDTAGPEVKIREL